MAQSLWLTTWGQLFKRDEAKDGKTAYILSIDYDDPGELCMTSESDETIQIYNVREGRHDKTLLSKKYGVKLAKFTHASSSIIYASTKQNGLSLNSRDHDLRLTRRFQMPYATSQHTTIPSSATSKATRAL